MNPNLLIIAIPDERIGFDHMHAWGTEAEMKLLAVMINERFGGETHLVEGPCPLCGAVPPKEDD